MVFDWYLLLSYYYLSCKKKNSTREGKYNIMTTAEVHVAIYDISMGMAKNMSGKLK